MVWYYDKDVVVGGQCGGQVVFKMQCIWERYIGKECGVVVIVLQCCDMFWVMVLQYNVVVIFCQGDGKSGVVRVGIDYSYCSIKCVYQVF